MEVRVVAEVEAGPVLETLPDQAIHPAFRHLKEVMVVRVQQALRIMVAVVVVALVLLAQPEQEMPEETAVTELQVAIQALR